MGKEVGWLVSCVDLIGWGDWMDWEEGCIIEFSSVQSVYSECIQLIR